MIQPAIKVAEIRQTEKHNYITCKN